MHADAGPLNSGLLPGWRFGMFGGGAVTPPSLQEASCTCYTHATTRDTRPALHAKTDAGSSAPACSGSVHHTTLLPGARSLPSFPYLPTLFNIDRLDKRCYGQALICTEICTTQATNTYSTSA